MADLNKVHHIVIGHDKIEEYNININILRNVFIKGKELLITAVYNGGQSEGQLAHPAHPPVTVDNFIAIKENKGYVWGAIDAIKTGLNFINTMESPREIVLLTNFDGLFFSEERYNWLIDDFIKSDKPFGSGMPRSHNYPLSDLMLFRKDFVSSFHEGMYKVVTDPSVHEWATDSWECEHHILSTLNVIGDVDKLWWRFERDIEWSGGRAYTFHKKYAFGHLHGNDQIHPKRDQYNAYSEKESVLHTGRWIDIE